MIQQAIDKLVRGEDLSCEQAHDSMKQIMSGETTDAQIGAFLVALRMKGEKPQEIAGFAQAMREKATPVKTERPGVIDMCGTGGDGAGTFNISTIASLVVAGCGIPVAKHGNRSVSSKCGSADLFRQLGVKIDLSADKLSECLDKIGFAFLFAPTLHQAMKYAIGPRREIGIRTVFNILGPITNPAGTKRQVIGVYDAGIARPLAEVLRQLGAEKVLMVYGQEGLDEVSISYPTRMVELTDGEIIEKSVTPQDFGLKPAPVETVKGGDVQENAEIALRILQGEPGAKRDVVVANAACGLYVAGAVANFKEGARLAEESIDSGAALEKLQELQRISNAYE
ncbi:MAG: anthranilate phosphoribosyltransferase [candidate division KSB1 bacterium]|nr:anthranilate phosphoribosyltransferase [candidate division KSB1 bacterium]